MQKDIFNFRGKKKKEDIKLPKTIYKFLDSFYPGNYILSKKYLLSSLEEEPIELVFASLVRLISDLIKTKIDPPSLTYPDWRLKKLKTLSEKYSLLELKGILKELATADIKSKTSKRTLIESLDLLILSKLQ